MIRVLLVEDDPVIRDTTCYFLKSQQNFEVVCAETGGYTRPVTFIPEIIMVHLFPVRLRVRSDIPVRVGFTVKNGLLEISQRLHPEKTFRVSSR